MAPPSLSVPVERAPLFATGALGGCVLLVLFLGALRSEQTVASLEAEAPREEASAVAAATSGPSASPAPSDPASAAPGASAAAPTEVKPAALRAPPVEVDRAITTEQLKDLAQRFPDDERVLLKLATNLAATPAGIPDALVHVRHVLELSGEHAKTTIVQQIVRRSASGTPAVQDVAFDLMSNAMGSIGPDLLYELTIAPGVAAPVRKRATEATKLKDVRAKATPELAIALDLRDRGPCARKELFPLAEKQADARALTYLTPLTSTRGCGVFDLADCYDECLGDRRDLNKAIGAIRARTKAK